MAPKTVDKGKKLVKKTINYLKKDDKNKIPLESLITLYDSHGIPPESINEIAKQNSFDANIPDNFYTLVAAEHSEEIPEEKAEIELDYPQTELLFYDNPSQIEFNAHILDIYKNNVILDQTFFYPEGGGQPSDIGFLNIRGEKIKVLHTEKIDNIVLHRVKEEDIQKVHPYKGQIIKGHVDPSRRRTLTQNHTATHLIIAAARTVLGDHIWQAGAQKGVDKSRIDISHYKRIKPSELEEIEFLANKLVMDNININTFWLDRTVAEKKYGFILYQGGVVPGMHIRTVEIEGTDVQACAGTHCNQTGDVGLIKIIRTERIQDGVERIEFSAGLSAIKTVQKIDQILKESSGIFKVDTEQLTKTCERFFTEWKAFKNEVNKLENEIASLKIEGITGQTEIIGDLTVLNRQIDADMGELIKIASNITEKQKTADLVVIANSAGKIVGAASPKALKLGVKANEIIKEVANIMGGGGGGKPSLAQGAGRDPSKLQEALNFVNKYLKNL